MLHTRDRKQSEWKVENKRMGKVLNGEGKKQTKQKQQKLQIPSLVSDMHQIRLNSGHKILNDAKMGTLLQTAMMLSKYDEYLRTKEHSSNTY